MYWIISKRALQNEFRLIISKPLFKGVQMTASEFKNAFKNLASKTSQVWGKVFDPQKHEALGTEETDAVPEGMISREFKKHIKCMINWFVQRRWWLQESLKRRLKLLILLSASGFYVEGGLLQTFLGIDRGASADEIKKTVSLPCSITLIKILTTKSWRKI